MIQAESISGQVPAPAGESITSGVVDKKAILRERARKLAQRPDQEAADEETLEVIEFMLAHEKYAIEVQYIREVYPVKDLTPVPCTPSYILGIINVRGQVISVTDLKEFFDLPKKEISDLFRVLIVNNHGMEFGVLADTVLGESRVPVSQVQSDLPALKGIREEFVKGVTKDRLIVINAERLLSEEAIVVFQEVSE
ncbi:MAG: chemotaxis protein CheW [Desulfomonile tiedjei]|nr:chemotaxis protein CheW [Desulfomonile tiedjei]